MTARIIHQTDLFHPHCDPDDHWDLACVYALAMAGDFKLESILIDYPPEDEPRQPDALGIAQMNYITGLSVPFAVGSSVKTTSRTDTQPDLKGSDENGVKMLLEVLANSPDPVYINIVGSARDVAIAGCRAPELFKEKCAGVYLNAGSGINPTDDETKVEYNVGLNPSAYGAIFDLPCPIFWMPCWGANIQYGTFYRFLQKDILEHLSAQMQKYFAFMFGRVESVNWLQYLQNAKDEKVLAEYGEKEKSMWCTGGFLHVAGKTVTAEGEIVDLESAGDKSIFCFEPIKVQCDDQGITRWEPGDSSSNRFIFHIRDAENYSTAMPKAMRALLKTLP